MIRLFKPDDTRQHIIHRANLYLVWALTVGIGLGILISLVVIEYTESRLKPKPVMELIVEAPTPEYDSSEKLILILNTLTDKIRYGQECMEQQIKFVENTHPDKIRFPCVEAEGLEENWEDINWTIRNLEKSMKTND